MDGLFCFCLSNYIIRASLGDSAVTCIYAFMTGRSQILYQELFGAVHQYGTDLGVVLEPESVTMDFEDAVCRAFETTFENVAAKGCFYHLTRNTWRHVQALGLSPSYKENEEVCNFCRMIDRLAFLPVDEVANGMELRTCKIGCQTYASNTAQGRRTCRNST